jgi:Protein of unknown function (DUF2798)
MLQSSPSGEADALPSPVRPPAGPAGPAKALSKAAIIQPILMAGVMAFLMTALITYLNLGFPADYVGRWLKAFAIAWPAATLAAYVAIPIARRATAAIVARLDGLGA